MKRPARLSPGSKSLERGSTFANSRSQLRRKHRKARGRPSDEQIAAKQRAACYLAHFSIKPCAGAMRLCHWIPKQRLRAKGVPEDAIWDERVVCNGCDEHHHELDFEAIKPMRIRRDQLPPGVEEYAAEWGLEGSLDRDYGPRLEVV